MSHAAYALDSDSDGIEDINDPWPQDMRYRTDSDSDGLPDEWEQFHFDSLITASGSSDQDNDGISDLTEFVSQIDDPKQAEPSIGSIKAIFSYYKL